MDLKKPKIKYDVRNIKWLMAEEKIKKEQFLKVMVDVICRSPSIRKEYAD